ncbi:ABC transporter substrate-binding protein [Lampropedia aestuarii]|uniref:ABC transporter substrate-binding protein n=1 Tax=Lampropedia aestuarii TaxID=2562762 RepID=UPI002468D595|nr:ABC transporter substrate-binding protein [Lampropedia aestuarii]MDH5858693.1 ABC transporter substrate-binding protein [Lampropedia aestuarii]
MKRFFGPQISALALFFGALQIAPVAAETVLHAVPPAPLRVLDPSLSTAQIVLTHGFMVFDTLLGLDEQFRPQPQMAEYTVSEDRMVYTLTLRDGLLWHDGTPVTAEDCVASLKRWGSNDSAGRVMMQHVQSIEAPSDKVLVITLAKPFGHVLDLLAKPSPVPTFMMPKRLAETPAAQPIAEMIGSGPFKFIANEFRPGDQAVYVKNTAYVPRKEPASWTAGGKVVKVDKVVLKSMPDMQTTLNALQAGDVDFVESVTIDLLPMLANNDDVKVGSLLPLGSQIVGQFNHRLPPFDNAKVRKAAMLALDQELFLQTAIGNPDYYQSCPSVYGCSVPLASEAGAEYVAGTPAQRMEQAKTALQESGYDGTPVVMLQPSDMAILNTQPIVAAERLREAGFSVEVVPMDWGALSARRTSSAPAAQGGWNMFFTAWGVPFIWNPLVNPLIDGSGKDGVWSGWRVSPEVEALRAQFLVAQDPATQQQLAQEIQQIAWDQGFYYNGGVYRTVSAWRNGIQGTNQRPAVFFWNIEK